MTPAHTLDQLKQLRLDGMLAALGDQATSSAAAKLGFDARLSLLVQREIDWRDNRRLARLLKAARLKVSSACIEDIVWRDSRNLDRQLVAALAGCDWVRHAQPILISGATGCGKTWLSCALARQADAVCFGSLAQRAPVARATIAALLDETRPDARRVFDINLRQHYYSREIIAASLQRTTVLKVNDQELPLLAPLLGLTGPPRAQLETLVHAYALEAVALTRGPHGSLLCVRGMWAEHPGCAVAARDTVGAGDAFTAALSLGLLRGWDAARISDAANRVAAFVCTQHGATPAMPPALRALFQSAS